MPQDYDEEPGASVASPLIAAEDGEEGYGTGAIDRIQRGK